MFTCPNLSCKKTFDAPLKTLNLQEDPAHPYNACPYCLTKLDQTATQEKPTPPTIQTTTIPDKPSPAGCRYHLGYLGTRPQNQQIPEDCLLCKNIVECMLSNMRK